jgi:hypothetical protein
MIERLHKFENLHILFWLGKDISWCLEWKIFGLIMIAPTLSLAILITYITRHTKREKFHNIAVCFWIAANSIWMIGEFYGHEQAFRADAKYLFLTGILFIFWHYISDFFIKRRSNETV